MARPMGTVTKGIVTKGMGAKVAVLADDADVSVEGGDGEANGDG